MNNQWRTHELHFYFFIALFFLLDTILLITHIPTKFIPGSSELPQTGSLTTEPNIPKDFEQERTNSPLLSDFVSIPTSSAKDVERKCLNADKTKWVECVGKASWYDYSLAGYPNYSKENYTAASRDYPRGTMLRVCRTCKSMNGQQFDREICIKQQPRPFFLKKCVDVRVNDYVENPKVIIDLSSKAFAELADLKRGIIDVEIIKL